MTTMNDHDCTDPDAVYAAMTPAEREEVDAYLDARRAEALAFQMEAEAPYEVPPWAPVTA